MLVYCIEYKSYELMISLIFDVAQAKITSIVLLTIKLIMDVGSSGSIMDILTADKITVTGLMLYMIYYFFTELKKEKKAAQEIVEKMKNEHDEKEDELQEKIDNLQKEKEDLLVKLAQQNPNLNH